MNNRAWIWTAVILIVIILLVVFTRGGHSLVKSVFNVGNGSSTPLAGYTGSDQSQYPNGSDNSGSQGNSGGSTGGGTSGGGASGGTTPNQFSAPIAYIGCSNTWMYVDGYHSVGGTKLWPDQPSYSGQTIVRWNQDISNNSGGWRAFDSANAKYPGAKTLWVLPCAFSTDNQANVTQSLINVINTAKQKIPTIQQVYVSGLNSFEDCSLTGTAGVVYTDNAASTVVEQGYALQGPTFQYLSKSETESNGCHPLKGAPRDKEGQVLLNFFG